MNEPHNVGTHGDFKFNKDNLMNSLVLSTQ